MKSIRFLLVLAGLCLLATGIADSVRAQVRVDGHVYGLAYAWDNAQSQRVDYYQGLQLRVRPTANLAFKTNLRLARRGDPAEWQERFYNAYADWRSPAGTFQARAGRQYVYRGVVNGSVDGLLLRARPLQNLDVQLVGGVAVPFDRPFKVQSWDDGGILGAYSSLQFAPEARVDVSYVQRSRQDAAGETVNVWQQAGTALTGAVARKVFYQAQLDYNLLKDEVQGMRYRLTYQPGPWTLTGEYNSQKPRIYEDSFFNLFQLVGFDQWRGGATYQVGRYVVGAQYLHTAYREDAAADEVVATVGSGWGTLGVIYQTGFGGDNVGLYGEVDYEVVPRLSVQFHSSYYNYQRRSIALTEDAAAFSGGLEFRPVRSVLLQARVEQAMNRYFDNDLRVLFRVNYAFSAR